MRSPAVVATFSGFTDRAPIGRMLATMSNSWVTPSSKHKGSPSCQLTCGTSTCPRSRSAWFCVNAIASFGRHASRKTSTRKPVPAHGSQIDFGEASLASARNTAASHSGTWNVPPNRPKRAAKNCPQVPRSLGAKRIPSFLKNSASPSCPLDGKLRSLSSFCQSSWFIAFGECFFHDGLTEANGALDVGGHYQFQLLRHAQPPLSSTQICFCSVGDSPRRVRFFLPDPVA